MFSCYLTRIWIIHNEHKTCPCVSWWIVTPWYLMENILSIQLSHTHKFYQHFVLMIDRSNKSKQKGWGEACFFISFMLFYNNMMWLSYGILCLMSPFSLYQVNPSVKRVLDTWLGYWYTLIPQICVVHPHEQYSHGCDSLSSVLFWCTLHFVSYCTIDLSHTSLRLKVYLVISHGIK